MAKVIGYDNSVYLRETCYNCGAIVEYAPNEVEEKHETDYTGCTDTVNCIRCPSCGNLIRGVKCR